MYKLIKNIKEEAAESTKKHHFSFHAERKKNIKNHNVLLPLSFFAAVPVRWQYTRRGGALLCYAFR